MKRAVLISIALLMAAGFVALGIWQVERRAWKHELMAAIDSRIHAPPVPAPRPIAWPTITAEKDAYRRVRVSGVLRHDDETLVQAVTDQGPGFWVLTPLQTSGFTILVNRGFVSPDRRDPKTRATTATEKATVTGLLRITEPDGGFLRRNDPVANRWYSRDVAAIAAARQLTHPAPYFIDADATPNPESWPIGGLTVVRFSDNHLIYALTWFALALLSMWAVVQLLRARPDRSHIPA